VGQTSITGKTLAIVGAEVDQLAYSVAAEISQRKGLGKDETSCERRK
jgi:hypothetical protein